MTDWDDLRVLLAISRRGSFLQAGAVLDMAASTLSRRITRLEQEIGEPVVERGVDGLRLTARGAALAAIAENLERDLQRQTLAQDGALSGGVTVTAGDGFVPVLTQAIDRYIEMHPRCTVDLLVDSTLTKVARGGIDIAVRTVHLGEPSLIYSKVAALSFGVYCAADYARRLPADATPGDAAMIDLSPPFDQAAHLRSARAAGFVSSRFRVSSFAAQLQACASGYGVAVLPDLLSAGLVQPFGAVALPPMDVFLVTRPQALRQPHLRAFFDVLRDTVRAAGARERSA
ncbi:LysR family transcriptional regulator [Pseudosulfitobacter pseudonitzschiae]|uniref:LysR family transcriptional regulator n=1 Tax=Pseudosulfitobacter pseudonitzschiae TaxID=1402135 RepID=UPI001AFC0552|nr:LysR family transcriptional regulator [Pseudosulfitobacter pseudonitzschiae]MBM1816837.1 LysR family transcriptional regulator [Pseudosulfitobacter pseudonitzschiae]MBM1833648.1 LysR family transcriptional regulator [Pseudosulfitobacter pseudonitzschiae]MBM1838514.1 LysR family transcriptional regulator [Pseudosulfitobacter pseudonitzschiae]MBM1843565.1 LysR family transcriptional regulator [Pseudosulfitobacter pseudonitzschiae]MBM1848430.1 LysR family transcriptional regulator [Pseudosulfi